VLNIEEVIPPGPKALEEVKGKVLSNYQNDIEAQWMDSLHKKYKVEVNKKALKHVKKDLK
jgi:peptidyl-prolyl cis-trans isomerase SurA